MSLYNELRPTKFCQVEGQDSVKRQLQGMFVSKRIPNGLLFTGPRGTGKTTMARIVARTLNCEVGGNEPCGECPACKSILNGTSLDVIELDAASNSGVEDVKDIIGQAQYAPMAKYKVFILDEVHVFSQNAWNALLKILEEPPINTVFIMCTTEEHKVPRTIVSRSRKLQFESLSLDTIASYLAHVCDVNNKTYEMDALKLIAIASEGGMRDALSIMEPFYDDDSLITTVVSETLGTTPDNMLFNILNALHYSDISEAISEVREASRKGINMQMVLKSIISALTNAMFVKNGARIESIIATDNYRTLLQSYVSVASLDEIISLSKNFADMYGTVLRAPDSEFFLESMILAALCKNNLSKEYELEKRIQILEEHEAGRSSYTNGQGALSQDVHVANENITEQQRKELEQAVPDDIKKIVGNWNRILGMMDNPMKTFMRTAKLSLGSNGVLQIVLNNSPLAQEYIIGTSANELQEVLDQAVGKHVNYEMISIEPNKMDVDFIDLKAIHFEVDIEDDEGNQ